MKQCSNCKNTYDEQVAYGICPYCGNAEEEISTETQTGFAGDTIDIFNTSDFDTDHTEKETRAEDPRWLPVGTLLHNRYEICSVLGAGGFGITYKVWDRSTETYRAAKEYFQLGVVNRIPFTTEVLLSAPKKRMEFEYGKNRFLQESTIVARFQSDSIVRVHEYFQENNTVYMIMEFLPYQTLENFILENRKTLTEEQAIHIGVNICDALTEIHAANVVHRDIAPDNIFINSEGKVKIIDFGSARLSKEDVDDKIMAIKPGYSAPEQYEKIDITNDRQQGWTDVYSLGATLYAALTGRKPEESSERKIAIEAGKDSLQDPRTINPYISESLNNTIMTALTVDIHERFQTAEAFKEALTGKVKIEHPDVVRKKKKLKRTAGIIGGFAAAACIIVAGVVTYINRDPALDEATVSIWYAEDEKGEKSTIFEQMREELAETDVLRNITIELKSIPEEDYEEELNSAYASGMMPVLYESYSVEAPYQQDAVIMNQAVDDITEDDCYFVGEQKDWLEKGTRIPIGFNIPVVYVNKTILQNKDSNLTDESLSKMSVSNMSDILNLCNGEVVYMPIAVEEAFQPAYQAMFTDFTLEGLEICDSEEFMKGNAAAYFSSTAEYDRFVKASVSGTGEYMVLPVGGDSVICRFTNYWSISNRDEDEVAAAEAIMEYFYTEKMQVPYYVESALPGIPLEKKAVARYQKVIPKLSGLFTDMNRYHFEKE